MPLRKASSGWQTPAATSSQPLPVHRLGLITRVYSNKSQRLSWITGVVGGLQNLRGVALDEKKRALGPHPSSMLGLWDAKVDTVHTQTQGAIRSDYLARKSWVREVDLRPNATLNPIHGAIQSSASQAAVPGRPGHASGAGPSCLAEGLH